jgi:DNA polymerase-1
LRLKPKKYRRLVLDTETDGLLHEVTVCHCIIVEDFDSGQVWKFRRNKREDTIEKAFDLLDEAEEIWGHNLIGYDLPMLELLFEYQPTARVRDSLVMARLLFPDQKDKDYRLYEAGRLDGKLIGKHKLEAWGQRVGLYKGDYKEIRTQAGIERGIKKDSEEMRAWVWGTWTQDLEDYCVVDVKVTVKLIQLIETRQTSHEAIYVQHRLADLMARQQETGFMFDVERGSELAGELRGTREGWSAGCSKNSPAGLSPRSGWTPSRSAATSTAVNIRTSVSRRRRGWRSPLVRRARGKEEGVAQVEGPASPALRRGCVVHADRLAGI